MALRTEGFEFDGPGPSRSLSGTLICATEEARELSTEGMAFAVVKTKTAYLIYEPKHLKVRS
ncbi:Hypothetical protein P9211_10261 [Prochlorococcus marinus str. MIT 9211]|uniref:Uncharacterized protein n=1 Tax=Prochlorococcus marinus (strain MIT 9211) TaxID=93059 RepID=A9BAU5_PROM4|nr:Hypothetical protein P9211_10261 [Prochlorococcus marinus str. MIT 9211]